MTLRNLGHSGLRVSLVGLGCNNFGQRLDLEGSRAVIHKALDAGITLFEDESVRIWHEDDGVLILSLKTKMHVIGAGVIAEIAPDLLDLLVPGAGLVTKAGAKVAGQHNLFRRRPAAPSPGMPDPAATAASPMAEQGRVFEQVTAVLLELARKRPLVLILDDVHWIDESSASLLFHLARRLEKSRILVICTYRSEEMAFARSESRHPLPKIVSEIKRQYGDVSVVLGDETPDETRQFIEALVDTEPNRLDVEFRNQLHERTRGHPLFATELLRDMQERGDLVHDEQGRWVPGPSLDWNALPARIEGVLEERIARVRQEVQELLTVASVDACA